MPPLRIAISGRRRRDLCPVLSMLGREVVRRIARTQERFFIKGDFECDGLGFGIA